MLRAAYFYAMPCLPEQRLMLSEMNMVFNERRDICAARALLLMPLRVFRDFTPLHIEMTARAKMIRLCFRHIFHVSA